jgi:hypothetical protein
MSRLKEKAINETNLIEVSQVDNRKCYHIRNSI